jgi:hypothetical protein
MAKISTYASVAPALGDLIIGTDVNDMDSTKNFTVGSIINLASSSSLLVPYTGANANVDLGAYTITSSSFIVGGGLGTQFLKADGSLDSTTYLDAITAAGTYVPFLGATQDVDLGAYNLTADVLTTTDRVQTSLIIPEVGSDIIDIGLKVLPYITVDTTNQRVEFNKPIYTDSSTGGAGQVLVSQGSALPATWATPPFIVPNYGSFYDVTTQTTLGASQELMQFGTTDFTSGVTITNDGLGDPTQITFSEAGTYNIQFSAQLENTSGGSAEVYIYLIKNGVAVPNSTTQITLANNNHLVVAAWNWFVDIPSIPHNCQIGWYSTTANVILHYNAAPVVGVPAIPSVILTVNRIA